MPMLRGILVAMRTHGSLLVVAFTRRLALSIPTRWADRHAGRYAGRVRFAAATISRYYDLPPSELLDAAGEVLHREVQPRVRPACVAHVPARRVAGPRPADGDPCDAYRSSRTVLLDASCTTHRLTVAVAVASGMRVLAEIGAAAPGRVRLRNGAGLITLRPGDTLRALRFVRGALTRRSYPARGSAAGARHPTSRSAEMGGRRWLLAVALLLCAGSVSPAQAATEPGAVVASDGTVELVATDDSDQLCLEIRDSNSDMRASGCGAREAGAATSVTDPEYGVQFVGVAVPAAAASVELRSLGKVVGGGVTVAGDAYKGAAAGSLRFALARLTRDASIDALRVHAIDAAGALVAVVGSGDAYVLDRHRLLSGRAGGVGWSLDEHRESNLAPTASDPAHETVSRCIGVDVKGGGGTITCSSGTPLDSLFGELDFLQAGARDLCSPRFRLLHGVLPASVKRVTVLMGDGRRRTAPTAGVRGGKVRVWGLAVGIGDAVRSVTLTPAGGEQRVLRQARAPVAVDCAVRGDRDLFTDFIVGVIFDAVPPLALPGPVTTVTGPPELRIADGPGETLCLAVAGTPFNAAGCEIVPALAGKVLRVPDSVENTRAVAFAVPAQVATVRLSSAAGKFVHDIPAAAADGYRGRYAGHVRFAAAAVSDYRELTRLELLDAAGKVRHREDEPRIPDIAPARVFAPRRVAGSIGRPSLWQRTTGTGDDALRCLALTAGPRPEGDADCQAERSSDSLLLDASCATHRLTFAVVVRPGTRALADVGERAPLRLAMRNGIGLLTLRPAGPLRALTIIRKGRSRRIAVEAPPGNRQCGWSAAPDISAP